jgi:flagellar motor switch protein FliN/FliY
MEEKDKNQEENKEISQEDLAAAWEQLLQEEPILEDSEKQKKETIESQEDLASQWASMLENEKKEEKQEETASTLEEIPQSKTDEENQEYTQNKQPLPSDIQQKLSILLDLPITITVEIGSKVMTLEDVLKLSPSSILDLDRYINEPIDLKVNGVLVAKGELYQVEDQFAIKIKDILTKEERVDLISKQFKR